MISSLLLLFSLFEKKLSPLYIFDLKSLNLKCVELIQFLRLTLTFFTYLDFYHKHSIVLKQYLIEARTHFEEITLVNSNISYRKRVKYNSNRRNVSNEEPISRKEQTEIFFIYFILFPLLGIQTSYIDLIEILES